MDVLFRVCEVHYGTYQYVQKICSREKVMQLFLTFEIFGIYIFAYLIFCIPHLFAYLIFLHTFSAYLFADLFFIPYLFHTLYFLHTFFCIFFLHTSIFCIPLIFLHTFFCIPHLFA
jgi:hypothetical protein